MLAAVRQNPPLPWWWYAVLGTGALSATGLLVYAIRRYRRRGPPLADEPAQGTGGDSLTWADNPYGLGWGSKDAEIGLGEKTQGGLPLSDRMLLASDCSGPGVKVIKWRYDIRLTNYFWHLWKKGERDPVLITMKVLELDSPQCMWPPDVDASEWADIIWNGTLEAVTNYVTLLESGELYAYAVDPRDPQAGMHVKPLVVWA